MDKARNVVGSIEGEYRRYKALGESAMAQLSESELAVAGSGESNSVATIAWHIAGNLASRFTDFLTTDGEKSWRERDNEFLPRTPSREKLTAHWEKGWEMLFETLKTLSDSDLVRLITIRGVALPVHAALHRSLAHTAYHIGQIVYVAKSIRGPVWESLSIPPGGSEAYNKNPDRERGGRPSESTTGV